MNIFFDNLIFSLQRIGGISMVWSELIKNLEKLKKLNVKYLEYKNANYNLYRRNLSINPQKIIRLKHFNKIFSQFKHPIIKSNKPFIFHSSYFRTCKNKNAINITTVHDFIYEQRKMSLKEKLRVNLNYYAIRNSQAIVCVSENTKKDLLKFVSDINPEKVSVIYNGVSEEYSKLNEPPYLRYNEYVLFVGGRQSYKNFEFLVKSLKDTKYNLLVCGAHLSKPEIDLLNTHLPNRYEPIVFPSNEELNKIYNSVFALVYPSSYEGFGIPVLEAQRAGCPVIAYNCSSIPEIIGNNDLLMNNLIPEELISKLNILENSVQRDKIITEGLQNSQKFSWKKMADEYLDLYQRLLNERSNK